MLSDLLARFFNSANQLLDSSKTKSRGLKHRFQTAFKGSLVISSHGDKPHLGPLFDNVPSVTISEVTNILRTMPSKSSPLDFIPTSLLKNCSDIFAPIICTLANLSFGDGNFPAAFKNAKITPLLKKPGLDADSPEKYRPISNLNTISKILEKLFSSRLKEHIRLFSNLNPFQSAYRQFHSTETALLRIMNDIFTSIDGKKITILVALDLSAAFDTIDHSALFASNGVYVWYIWTCSFNGYQTYLNGRDQYVKVDDSSSENYKCQIGVPQGSVLGPLLFSLFVAPVSNVVSSFGVNYHQYADDTQLFIGCECGEMNNNIHLMNTCTTELNKWFLMNGLCLNPSKSESIFLGTGAQVNKVRSISSILVADNPIDISREIKSPGSYLMKDCRSTHTWMELCKSAHFHIRALRHIRQSLSTDVAKTVACSIIGSRIDYCNSLLNGVSAKNIDKLQRVQNTVARVITGHRKSDHIMPILRDLHWLPIRFRIKFKLCTIVFKTLVNNEPVYLRGSFELSAVG